MSRTVTVLSAELDGIEARAVEVETDVNVGLHSFTIVGLADKALSEAKERVNSALKNIGVKPPSKENRRIVVNLAPAVFKKTGSHYDLAIAVGYLLATDQLRWREPKRALLIGELSLDGRLRPVNGVLGIASLARRLDRTLFLPAENAKEAAIVDGMRVIPVPTLNELINYLEERTAITTQPQTSVDTTVIQPAVDISEIKGQAYAKRALTIAAAGGHNLLMVGPPGTGKTMLAQALVSILPPLTRDEIIETTKIYSAAGLLGGAAFVNQRPFRSPHQSASLPAIVGGGQSPKPGEISLAHRGVLFLDELPEFRRDILEALRQPIESGKAYVSRVKNTLIFPANFTLIAAMNPCPCGYWGDDELACRCSAYEVIRYKKKISGPLLDRIDLQINVPRIPVGELRGTTSIVNERMRTIELVNHARVIQLERLRHTRGKLTNADLSSKECETLLSLAPNAESFLDTAAEQMKLSPRAYYRTLKVAQTIADLGTSSNIEISHIAEALSYKLNEGN